MENCTTDSYKSLCFLLEQQIPALLIVMEVYMSVEQVYRPPGVLYDML
jgi:hypothetical protein